MQLELLEIDAEQLLEGSHGIGLVKGGSLLEDRRDDAFHAGRDDLILIGVILIDGTSCAGQVLREQFEIKPVVTVLQYQTFGNIQQLRMGVRLFSTHCHPPSTQPCEPFCQGHLLSP
ncbi:hypothetical protein D3C76_1381970 [compost metagenome]